MKPHGVAIQPAPKVNTIVGWQSPVTGNAHVTATISHAHPNCGYHVNWSLELRRGATRVPLAAGVVNGAHAPKIDPIDITLRTGDLLAIVVAPPENQTCALIAVDVTITSGGQTWDLAKDLADDVLAGNPHADRLGNKRCLAFFHRAGRRPAARSPLPRDRCLSAGAQAGKEERAKLAAALEQLLMAGPTPTTGKVDADLYHRLASLNGPLLSRLWKFDPGSCRDGRHGYPQAAVGT